MSRCEWCGAPARGTAVQAEFPYAVRISCGDHGEQFTEERERRYDPIGTAAFVGLCIAAVISLFLLPFAVAMVLMAGAVLALGKFVMWGLGSNPYVRRRRR